MKENVTKVAELLLQIKSIKLEPANPFKWASGWNSPIYCDNRETLSFPKVRNFIKSEFVNIIRNKYPEAELIAGVATGAIAIGALVADAMDLPFVYVRPKPKDHGMGNQVEGSLLPGQKVVIVEDLISTGNSSLNALAALRAAQTEVLGMVAIFSYKFKLAEENFRINNCELTTLSNYPALLDLAVKSGQISAEQLETLNEWRKDPGNWTP